MAGQQRVIRVFISSTFRDMQAEREELVKRIFPQLRKLCEQRGVTWGEVDLRWGISDEQQAEGKVLPICLQEIQRCRPYFIGLLGERYGSLPAEIPAALIQQEPWLVEHLDRSLTELEILHGVLNNPQMAQHSFFYFRSPSFLDKLPPDQQEAFRETPSPDEVSRFGPEEAQRRREERRRRLAALKERIRGSGVPVREDYPDPQTLGQWVLQDLREVVDRLYPEGSQPDPLDRETAEHEAFAAARAKVYIGREAYFARLDAHAEGNELPLVVLGESGAGKSALLANWAIRYRLAHPETMVLIHFIGATPYSADWASMLRRIMGEFKRRFNFEGEIPDRPDALRLAFANWLHMAAAQGRLVLILDALNQLEDREGALDLVWLPPLIPTNVRLILSTLPGRPLHDLRKRAWPTLQVEPLQSEERQMLIQTYLEQYTKALTRRQVERIADAPQTANPLYLRALLEELRVYGDHATLDRRIDYYLAANTVADLYERILQRYEEDYERERPGLVRGAMALLWAARRGLSEAELLELLGANGELLPRAHWSPLYLVAEPSLVSRSGLIGFFHDYLRQAVQDRYLPAGEEQQAAHLRLAGYFAGRDLGPRKVDELPWQLVQAESWERLYALLADLSFFKAAWAADQFEVKAYWAQVEAHSPLRLVDACRPVLDAPARYVDYVSCFENIAVLLRDTGHPDQALSLLTYLAEHYRRIGDQAKLQTTLTDVVGISIDRGGDLDEAMALLKEQEQICHQLGDKSLLGASLNLQGKLFVIQGKLDEAMSLFGEVERIARELGNEIGVAKSLNNQAGILHSRGDLDGAMALLREMERISREVGDKFVLAWCLGHQANILDDRGDLDGAMALHKEAEQMFREVGDRYSLATSLGNEALVLRRRGDPAGAMVLLREQEQICRESGYKEDLAHCLQHQATIRQSQGDLGGAMVLSEEAEQICRESGYREGLALCLNNQAMILQCLGDLDRAMALCREAEQIWREVGSKRMLALSFGRLASIFRIRGDLDSAMVLVKEAEQICREAGYKVDLAFSLSEQGLILEEQGDLDKALVLLQEAERTCREVGYKELLADCLNSQGLLLQGRGQLDKAMALLKENTEICRELGYRKGLADSHSNQGLILQGQGNLDGAMALFKEAEQAYREMGTPGGLATSLTHQATILAQQGHRDKALPLAEEAERLVSKHGLAALARRLKPVLDNVRSRSAALHT